MFTRRTNLYAHYRLHLSVEKVCSCATFASPRFAHGSMGFAELQVSRVLCVISTTARPPRACAFFFVNAAFGSTSALQVHMRSHLPPDMRRFKCSLCPRGFNKRAAFEAHTRKCTGQHVGMLTARSFYEGLLKFRMCRLRGLISSAHCYHTSSQ
jgi:hypothetical protein